MTSERNEGVCERCKQRFRYYLIHNGFNESSYAYCDSCGMTALLDGWKVSDGVQLPSHQVIGRDVEAHLLPCVCGGKFVASAAPRCPHCSEPLSPHLAKEFIEANAEGTRGGWRWQENWTGLYCVVINGMVVHDPWKLV
jgi:hypothetical protein